MKKPPLLTVPTFVLCYQHVLSWLDQGEKSGTGLGTWSALFSAWSGSPYTTQSATYLWNVTLMAIT